MATVHLHGGLRRFLASALSVTLVLGPSVARAVPVSERAADVPLAVDVDGEAEDVGDRRAASATGASRAVSHAADASASVDAPRPLRPPPPRIQPRTAPVRVAVGLGPTTAGNAVERAILARLEASVAASTSPETEVRRLRPGAGEPRAICRARRDDLVILVDYLPEREEPVLLPHECGLDQPLGVRGAAAADEPGLVGVLWEERQAMVTAGMEERRARTALSPKVRRGLIAGGAVVALGVALGVVLAASLRPRTAVITVGP